MGNQIALAILGRPGTELIVEQGAHIMVSELGGAAYHSGLQTRGLPGYQGRLSVEQVRATAWSDGDFWTPRRVGAGAREHAQHGRRHGLAARRAGARSSTRRANSVSGCISTERGS